MRAQNRAILHALVESPFRESIICLVLVLIVLCGSYAISTYAGSRVYFFAGIGVMTILLIYPVLIGTGLFLLWKNPQKYKEKDMKRRREQRRKSEAEK